MLNRLKATLADFFQQADLVLLSLCLVSTLYGIMLIASATNYRGTLRYVVVQAVATGIGVVLYIALSMVDVEVLVKKWTWILAFNVGFILLLIPFGVESNGNKAWIQFSWMPTSVQPAEIVKITFILLLAKQLEWLKEEKRQLRTADAVLPAAGHLLFMVGLIYVVSGDMGSALVYGFVFLCMSLVAGVAWRWYVIGFAAAGAGIAGLYWLGKIPSYMVNRFHALFDHSYDPLGTGWQQTRSLLAIGSGQIFGQGLFNGTQTQSTTPSSLPYRHTDFIFAVAGEELGMVGCLVIIALLTAIIFRCLQVARRAQTPFPAYVCTGMAGMLIFQTVENIGMCLFVMPVIGLTLPFFSYGGSSIVTLYAAMGIVSGIKKRAMVANGRRMG